VTEHPTSVTSERRTSWTPRRRRGAAIQLILGGVLLMVVPMFLGDSVVAQGFRALAPVAWLMAVAGAALLLLLRETRKKPAAPKARPSGAVPLHPEPVRKATVARPLVRPELDPLDWMVDTQSPQETAPRRR
jgi:hypothetical protein